MSAGAELSAIETHGSAVAALVERATTHRIVDDLTREGAADIRSALKQAEKRVEEARTALVKPLNDHVKVINARFKPMTDHLAAALRSIDGEIIRDRREREAAAELERRRLEQERLAAETKAREEQERRAREAAEKAAQEAAVAGMKPEEQQEIAALYAQEETAKPLPPVIQAAPPPPPPKQIVSATGATVTTRKVWDCEVTDLVALARAMPAALEVARKPILDYLRALEAEGRDAQGIAKSIGIRAFKRDSVG